jgi:hypothetical protein
MKIARSLFIYTILLCFVAQGSAQLQVCVERECSDSDLAWASKCHNKTIASNDFHHFQGCLCGQKDIECIDISITSIANYSSQKFSYDQVNDLKPIILKRFSPDHLFSFLDFPNLKASLFPVFTDITSLSIKSTVLVI